MRVFTVKNKRFLDELNKKGEISGSQNEIEKIWPEFIPAYSWMIAQMKSRGLNPNELFPIWVWNKKPDLRYSLFKGIKDDEDNIIIELEIDERNILFSSFDLWHNVLNRYPISKKEYADDVYLVDHLSEADKSFEIKEWESIFDKENLTDKFIQGVVSKVYKTQIIKIYY